MPRLHMMLALTLMICVSAAVATSETLARADAGAEQTSPPALQFD